MPIIQPGRGGGIQGRGVSARCGQGGRRGRAGLVAACSGGLDRWPSFSSPKFYGSFTASGVTKDSTGAALSDCTVDLFSESEAWLARTVSDGSGNYTFTGVGVGTVFVRAYKPGAPDLAGTTLVFAPVAVP